MKIRPGYKQTEVGAIPEAWDIVLLDSVAKRGSGHTPDKAHPEYWGGKIKWVSLQDSDRLDRLYISDTAATITPAGIANSSARLHPEGTVVLSRDAGVGKSAIIKDDMAVSQHFVAWTCKPQLSNHFLYYWFQSNKSEFERIAMGSTIKTIGLSYFRQYIVPLPTQAEQEAIAEALSHADAYIESLGQLLDKNRQLKQGSMHELFRTKPADKVRLLQDVSSLKGRIGWQGLKQAEFTTNEDEPFLITGINFRAGAIRWGEVYHISEARYEMAPDIQVRPRDVLMTKDGTIGKVLYIDAIPYPGKASLNSHLLLLRPAGDSYNPKYLYYQLDSQRFKDYIELSKTGTTFSGLSQAAVGAYPVLLPPMEEQVYIAGILSDLDAAIAALEAKLTKARQLKQGMMQELLTGRIRLV